jgi:hypothetical protein
LSAFKVFLIDRVDFLPRSRLQGVLLVTDSGQVLSASINAILKATALVSGLLLLSNCVAESIFPIPATTTTVAGGSPKNA